ncbi:MAG TPA: hypothetical protein VD864_15725 [Nocardioides sp.]|nr:hypothetical protein [Nocardioides sp.]
MSFTGGGREAGREQQPEADRTRFAAKEPQPQATRRPTNTSRGVVSRRLLRNLLDHRRGVVSTSSTTAQAAVREPAANSNPKLTRPALLPKGCSPRRPQADER